MSQILVVFPLPSFATEDMLARDLKNLEKSEESKTSAGGPTKLKSTAPTADSSRFGARPGSLHRIFLMRDVSSQESFKYGFVEFWTLEDAAAAIEKIRNLRTFTVAGCAVTIAPTHMGVFLPEEREVTPDIEHMSFHPLFNPDLLVRYRDLHLFPSQLVVAAAPPADVSSGAVAVDDAEAEKAKKQKKRKAEASIGAAAKKQVPMAGQMAVWQRKHDELHQDSGSADAGPKTDGKAAIKISLSNATKLGTRPEAAPASPPKAVVKEGIAPSSEEPSVGDDSAEDTSFVDRDRLMCLICMRKYKSIDEVNIHERSKNHKTATEDPEKVKAAMPRLAAVRARRQKEADSLSQYRDRAKERRSIYNQPTQPSSKPAKGDAPVKKAKAEESKPAASKGAGMLAKMGWTAGSGLGANQDGRTEAIATNAYQGGVGLGAEGSNLGDAADLAERKTTNSYAQYVSSVQDKARQRYNQMD